jgi:uncharacterized protein (DUF169 family)
MPSHLTAALNLQYPPVAILWTDEKPEGAIQFTPGRWGCVMASFAAVAEKGKVAAFDRASYGCFGGGVGLGFGNCYEQFPGGADGFCGFLADGNGEAAGGLCPPSMREHFVHGERYRQSAAVVARWVEDLPTVDIPTPYVVFKRLDDLAAGEVPQVVVLLADADQMSGLVVLANYRRSDSMGAIIPHGAGCQTIGIFAYAEAASETPRAVVGLVDPSARATVRRLGKGLVTVALPYALYQQLDADVPGSFLECRTWKSLEV